VSAAIVASGLGVRFQLSSSRRVVTPALARMLPRGERIWGLRGLDLAVGRGESVALVGPSGSGKTTLLRVLAGVLPADEGQVHRTGRVAAVLAVQAGVLGKLTGEENAVLLAVLNGLSRRDAREALPGIHERSGLGRAFRHPVSTYSQGMRARLAFAVAECAEPEILLLDEVHEALDHEYRSVVEGRVRAICAAGGIVVAAGHDHQLLGRMCDRVVRLAAGAVAEDGTAWLEDADSALAAERDRLSA
jgi:ABC-type polysaccharide/polyol phosphate transport system ATPase subunit